MASAIATPARNRKLGAAKPPTIIAQPYVLLWRASSRVQASSVWASIMISTEMPRSQSMYPRRLARASAASRSGSWAADVKRCRERVLAEVSPLAAETVAAAGALGRVLAEDVRAPTTVPPFDSSAMDGFAVVAGAGGASCRSSASRAPGHPSGGALEAGRGDPRSPPAPWSPRAPTRSCRSSAPSAGRRAVRVPGTEAGAQHPPRRRGHRAPGDAVLPRGHAAGPGRARRGRVGRARDGRLRRRPRVAVLRHRRRAAASPGEPLGPGRIHNSNALLARRAGRARRAPSSSPREQRRATTRDATRAALGAALDGGRRRVVSGGVSVGPHDHVKAALAALGVEERFWGVRAAARASRPGSACAASTLAFGLPGNPVSAMVTFQLFVRPALAALQGADPAAAAHHGRARRADRAQRRAASRRSACG